MAADPPPRVRGELTCSPTRVARRRARPIVAAVRRNAPSWLCVSPMPSSSRSISATSVRRVRNGSSTARGPGVSGGGVRDATRVPAVSKRCNTASRRSRATAPGASRKGSSASSTWCAQLGDLDLLDHPRGTLQGVGQAQQARDHLPRPAAPARARAAPLAEPLQQLAGLDAEVLVGILRHRVRPPASGRISRARSFDSLVSWRRGLQRLAGAGLGLLGGLGDVGHRDVHLLDRGGLLLGADSSISRAASVVVPTRPRDLLERRPPPRRTAARPRPRPWSRLSVAMTVVLTAARTSSISAADLLGRAAHPVGQLADLVRHHGEAPARLARAGRLDGGVDGQDVRLLGQLVDDLEDRRRSAGTWPQLEHVADDQVHLPPDRRPPTPGRAATVSSPAAGGRRVSAGDLGHPLGALRDLAGGREQLA